MFNHLSIPFHPILVHFPIALFFTACLFQLLNIFTCKDSFHHTAIQVYVLGSMMAILAVISGWVEANELHLKHPILNSHRFFAFFTLGVALTGLVVLGLSKRYFPKYFRQIFTVLVLMVAILSLATGYYGGRMVYEYAVGVEIS